MRLSFEKIRDTAAGSVQVVRRQRACVEYLLRCTPEERGTSLKRQLCLLDEATDGDNAGKRDPAIWRQSDPQG